MSTWQQLLVLDASLLSRLDYSDSLFLLIEIFVDPKPGCWQIRQTYSKGGWKLASIFCSEWLQDCKCCLLSDEIFHILSCSILLQCETKSVPFDEDLEEIKKIQQSMFLVLESDNLKDVFTIKMSQNILKKRVKRKSKRRQTTSFSPSLSEYECRF